MKKRIKNILFKKILPFVIIISFTITGVVFPFASSAAVADIAVEVLVGFLFQQISELLIQLSTNPTGEVQHSGFVQYLMDRIEDNLNNDPLSMAALIGDGIEKVTEFGEIVYRPNDNYFDNEYDKRLALMACEMLNSQSEIGYIVDGEEIKFTKEQYWKLLSFIRDNVYIAATDSQPLPPVVEEGVYKYEVGEESFTINGTKVTMKDFPVDMGSLYKSNLYANIVPCFKYNETLYILCNVTSGQKNANGIVLSFGSDYNTFWVIQRNGFINGVSNGLYFNNNSKVFNSICEGNNIIIKNSDNKFSFTMVDSFVNFETKELITIDYLGLTKSQVRDRLKVLVYYHNKQESNILLSTSTVTDKKEKNIMAFPIFKVEDIINQSIKRELVSENPEITISKSGVVTVDGIDTKTLEQTLVWEQTGNPDKENSTELDIDMPVIWDKFPFSIPFDIYGLFTILAEKPKPYKVDIPFSNKVEGDYEKNGKWYNSDGTEKLFILDYSIGVDLSEYEILSTISRSLLFIGFLIGLALATNKLIGRG